MKGTFEGLNTKCAVCDKTLTKNNYKQKAIIVPGNKRICDKCYDGEKYKGK